MLNDNPMRIRSTVLATFGALVLAGGMLPGCGQEKSTPGLMLAFTSDMSVPKDVSAVGLYIRSRTGTVIYNNVVEATVDASGNRTVRFPSTFAVLSNGSPATVRVQLIAYGPVTTTASGSINRKAIVMRESTTGVPTDRLSLLRMPLLWINQGSVGGGATVTPTSAGNGSLSPLSQSIRLTADETLDRPDTGYKSPCTDDQSFIGGKCRTIDPSAPLPEYTEADKPGSQNALCFNVEACYKTPTSLLGRIGDDGSVDIGSTRASLVNLALITKDQVGIKLPDGRFAISLDSDSEFEGFTIVNDKIVLSEAVRDAIKSGRAIDLVATSSCAVKTPDVGNCGPWNPGATPVEPTPGRGDITLDGGAFADASSDAPVTPVDAGDGGKIDLPPQGEGQGGGEPKLMGLAIDNANVYTVRNGNGIPNFDTDFRYITKGDPSQTKPIGSPITAGDGYRVTRLSFSGASAPWGNNDYLAVYKGAPGGSSIYLSQIGTTNIIALPLPAGAFYPVGVIPTVKGPVFVGPNGLPPAIYGYTDLNTLSYPTFSGLSATETPTSIVPNGAGGFHLGTSESRVMDCTLDAAQAVATCTLNATGPAGGVVVDLAKDGTSLFALVARRTDPQQNYEGVYRVTGSQFVAAATRTAIPTLHLEPAGATPSTVGTGPRNRIALSQGLPFGFVSSASDGGPSEVFKFDRTTPQTVAPFSTGLKRVLDIATDETHLYYVDYGSGTMADGRVYRRPLK